MVEEEVDQYVEANGLNMYYQDSGSGSPLVLIHGGIATSGMNWESSIPLFAKHFRVISFDSRGHGRTDNPSGEFNYRLMADDTVAKSRTVIILEYKRYLSSLVFRRITDNIIPINARIILKYIKRFPDCI